jgi:spermidine/putrescine ABC transporter ATP-binding subunit
VERIGAVGARVVFDELEKRFGTLVAVDRISIDIAPGEFLTLLGPSGSGKSTSLLMLAGFEEPTDGEILIDGRSIAGVPPYRRNIGMVFQNYALFPHMTVGENIAFPLQARKLPREEVARRIGDVLDLVKLPGYERRYPRQLSGGQQQRVALARALVYNPRVLLMDEPLGALDKHLRERLQLEIKALHEQLKVTIIYVTHDQEEALIMSDRIAVMNQGRIEQIGTPSELYDAPSSRFVASFIGESNLFEGRIVAVEPDRVSVDVPGIGLLIAPNRESVVADSDIAVTVRPEKIVFTDGGVFGSMNALDAVVEGVVFVGDSRRYEVRAGTGLHLVVKQHNRAGLRQYQPGDAVHLQWHVDDTRLV